MTNKKPFITSITYALVLLILEFGLCQSPIGGPYFWPWNLARGDTIVVFVVADDWFWSEGSCGLGFKAGNGLEEVGYLWGGLFEPHPNPKLD